MLCGLGLSISPTDGYSIRTVNQSQELFCGAITMINVRVPYLAFNAADPDPKYIVLDVPTYQPLMLLQEQFIAVLFDALIDERERMNNDSEG